MEWKIKYIEILSKKFNLLKNIKSNTLSCNYDLDTIIKELNSIIDIKQFVLKIYIVKKIIKSMSFHLVAKTDKFIELNILNNNSKNKKIDINFKYIDSIEYDSMEYKSTNASAFGYNIWKYSVKEKLLNDFADKIEWTTDIQALSDDMEMINNNPIDFTKVSCIANLYSNSYALYDYNEKEYLYILENDSMIYHLYYIVDDCSAEDLYTDIRIKEYNSIEEFIETIPECIFHKYYKNSESLQYNDFKYMVEMDYIYELYIVNLKI